MYNEKRKQIKTPPELESSSPELESSSPELESSPPELESSSPELLMFYGGKVTRIAFFSFSFSSFSGKIRNEEKKMRVHVILHNPFRPIPQKTQSRKDPSREARKFTGLENLVPIPSCDNPLWVRSAVQIHNCQLHVWTITHMVTYDKTLTNCSEGKKFTGF